MLALLSLIAALAQGDYCPDCGPASRDVEPPVVILRVQAPAKGNETGRITYRVTAVNRSSAKALDVKIKLDLSEKTTLQASKPEAERQQKTLVWRLGTLEGQCQKSIEVTLESQSDGPVEACFRIAYEHGVCVTTTACKSAKAKDEVLPTPKNLGQLTVQKIAPARQGMGTPILYSITVTNSGKVALRDVDLTDLFPPNAVYVPGTADNSGQLQGPENKKMVWRLGTMLPGEVRTVTFKVRPSQAGTYLNVANAQGLDADGVKVVSNNSHSTTDISGMATLYMEVKDTADPIFVGGTTMYTILVRNTGTAAATNIRVLAEVPVGLTVTEIRPAHDADASGFKAGEQRINFPAFVLQPGQEKTYQIRVKAERAALFRFRTTLNADTLDPAKGPLYEEETTAVETEIPIDKNTRLATPSGTVLVKSMK